MYLRGIDWQPEFSDVSACRFPFGRDGLGIRPCGRHKSHEKAK